MDALLITVGVWLSVNFGLPADVKPPAVTYATPLELTYLSYRSFSSYDRDEIVERYSEVDNARGHRRVVAVYDMQNSRIILTHGWDVRSPVDLSVLVHEMVHHLQQAAGTRYDCAAQREKLAFAAQDKWLGLFGLTLHDEFGIDPFTLLVQTSCAP